jgi:hypothetical protein
MISEFIAWDSQPLDDWAVRYAAGNFKDLAGCHTHLVERGQGKLLHGRYPS